MAVAVRDRLAGWRLALLFIGLGTLIRVPQLDNSLVEAFAFRQTQTAFVAREYVREGVDIFRTPLPVLGADADVPMEMPLFQAVVALVDQLGVGSTAEAARLVGLAAFQVAGLFLFTLVRRWHGYLAGIVTLGLFQLSPFGLQWGAAALIDFPAVALALGMVVGLDSWFTRANRWGLVLGSASAILAFLVKATTAPMWVILLAASSLVVVRQQGWSATWRRQLIGYVTGPVAGMAAALAWTHYADGVKATQPLTGFLVSSELAEWNFGTLAQRTDIGSWVVIVERVLDSIAGAGLAVVAIALVLLAFRSSRSEFVRYGGWALVAISGPFVFFNLYAVHDYYLVAVYPAVTALIGIGIAVVVSRIGAASRWAAPLAAGAAAVVVLLSASLTGLGQQSIKNFSRSNDPPNLAVAMASESGPDDRWIMVGCDWDPVYLFAADRRGVMFREADDQGFWDVEDPSRYTRLATCPDAPAIAPYLPPGTEALPIGTEPGVFEVVAGS